MPLNWMNEIALAAYATGSCISFWRFHCLSAVSSSSISSWQITVSLLVKILCKMHICVYQKLVDTHSSIMITLGSQFELCHEPCSRGLVLIHGNYLTLLVRHSSWSCWSSYHSPWLSSELVVHAAQNGLFHLVNWSTVLAVCPCMPSLLCDQMVDGPIDDGTLSIHLELTMSWVDHHQVWCESVRDPILQER